MYWTEIKSALLYGQPSITYDALQPQAVEIAVREITRLLNFGWVDELTDEVLQRIQTACQTTQRPEIWDEFRVKNQSFFQSKRRKKGKKIQRKSKLSVANM